LRSGRSSSSTSTKYTPNCQHMQPTTTGQQNDLLVRPLQGPTQSAQREGVHSSECAILSAKKKPGGNREDGEKRKEGRGARRGGGSDGQTFGGATPGGQLSNAEAAPSQGHFDHRSLTPKSWTTLTAFRRHLSA
jgi:hypothetical protein